MELFRLWRYGETRCARPVVIVVRRVLDSASAPLSGSGRGRLVRLTPTNADGCHKWISMAIAEFDDPVLETSICSPLVGSLMGKMRRTNRHRQQGDYPGRRGAKISRVRKSERWGWMKVAWFIESSTGEGAHTPDERLTRGL